jgi:hypothetical protein
LSLAGKLEDVPLADVMQFIHLGRRTGTLTLQRAGEHAEITFHRGAIVGARSPSSRRLGELLVDEGILDADGLDEALVLQERDGHQQSLGQILLARGTVAVEPVRDAIRAQIERTIYELVTWAHGSFIFELDTLKPVDDIAVYPGDLIPDIDLNTQMVLLEAARIFDERNRSDGGAEEAPRPAPPPPAPAPAREREVPSGVRRVEAADLFGEERPAPEPRRLPEGATNIRMPEETATPEPAPAPALQLVVGSDDDLALMLAAQLALHGIAVERVSVSDAGIAAPGEPPPIVAVELREGETTLRELAQICSSKPGLPVICIVEDVTLTAKAYEAGAAAVVPRDPEAVVGCVASIARFRGLVSRGHSAEQGARSAFAKLRRVVADLRSGVFSASVALNLMNIIAESVERAVLFLVRRDGLTALGAFGFNDAGRPLAEATRGFAVPVDQAGALGEAIRAGRAISVSFDEAGLPDKLSRVLGRPKTGQVVLFPVLGTDRVILVIYTDNGPLDQPIEEIDIIDLAAAEVGIAFENELLRRQLSKK